MFSHARPPPSLDSEKHASLVSLWDHSHARAMHDVVVHAGVGLGCIYCFGLAAREAAAQWC